MQSTAPSGREASITRLVFGAEGAPARATRTDAGPPLPTLDACDPASFFNSSNRTTRDDVAFFAQDSVCTSGPTSLRWPACGGISRGSTTKSRFPTHPTIRQELLPDLMEGGPPWNPTQAAGLYASYGDSFQPPDGRGPLRISQLRIEPGPRTRGCEELRSVGFRGTVAGRADGRWRLFSARTEYTISIFRTDLTNEIIFVSEPTPGNPFGGANQNAAKSRRQGVEVTGSWRGTRWLSMAIDYSYTDATFESGTYSGNEVPLVPKNRVSLTAAFALPKGVSARLTGLAVGEQVLTGDEANARPRLDSYVVLNARAAWRPRGGSSQALPPIGNSRLPRCARTVRRGAQLSRRGVRHARDHGLSAPAWSS